MLFELNFFLLSRENKNTLIPFQKMGYGFSLKHTYFVLGMSMHQRIGCGSRIQAHNRSNRKDY